jgi:hypothetical protein
LLSETKFTHFDFASISQIYKKEQSMKYIPFFSLIVLLAMLVSACQADNTALGRVQTAVNYYQSGNGNSFEQQLTRTLRQSSPQCPNKLQYSCIQLAYKNFAAAHQSSVQSPQSFTFVSYEKQTTPNVKMVLVEGNWGGSPALTSCQVFFVLTDGSTWLIDNFDEPQAMTCEQRGKELTENLFGGTPDNTTPKP